MIIKQYVSEHFVYSRPSGCPKELCGFMPQLSFGESQVARELMKTFTEVADRENIIYFLVYGSLLGSYRHGGPIPWDDDLDVMIEEKDESALTSALQKLAPAYGFVDAFKKGQPGLLKLFVNASSIEPSSVDGRHFNYPFLDVFLFRRNETSLMDVMFNQCVVDLSLVFPLVKSPFYDLMVSAPRDASGYLQRLGYDVRVCTNIWNHRHETPPDNPPQAVDCERLFEMYEFRGPLSNWKRDS